MLVIGTPKVTTEPVQPLLASMYGEDPDKRRYEMSMST
jgi:hypothetical protein